MGNAKGSTAANGGSKTPVSKTAYPVGSLADRWALTEGKDPR